MKGGGIAGPIFVSIGNADKLGAFLDANPDVPRGNIFVDDLDFDAYNAMDLPKMILDDNVKGAKVYFPGLSFGQWMSYFSLFNKLAPVPDFEKLEIGSTPEGVLRLGGTFVVDGNDVVYQWIDRIPTDTPDVDQVLKVAIDSNVGNKNAFESFFSSIF